MKFLIDAIRTRIVKNKGKNFFESFDLFQTNVYLLLFLQYAETTLYNYYTYYTIFIYNYLQNFLLKF